MQQILGGSLVAGAAPLLDQGLGEMAAASASVTRMR
jgi:hypothetical protein